VTRPRVLLVDDDPAAAAYARLALGEEAWDIRTAVDGLEALLLLERWRPAVVVSDVRMPRLDGRELLRHVRSRWPDLPVILLTVEQDIEHVVRDVQAGACDYVVKPASPARLRESVLRASRPRPAPGVTAAASGALIGVSRSMVEVRRLVELAARSDVPVLVVGETGTGKELVARSIHAAGPRRSAPYVPVNCAAVPAELFESEFFGHCRGAYTGALVDRPGRIEEADGGTLFLDELETLTEGTQAKLLRVLEDGEVRRVGGSTTRRVSARTIAATNRDPAAMLRVGALRPDLYYRLRGFEIVLPPLRDRIEDLPLLVGHLIADPGRMPDRRTLDGLAAREWPGNVRELRNAVRWAEILAPDGALRLEHFPAGRDPGVAPHVAPSSASGNLREMEEAAIRRALDRHAGNRSGAARELGIDRSTLRRRLRDMELRDRDR
jgi:DNA-binding NtrC family response regulator